jgi:hypothetical protein
LISWLFVSAGASAELVGHRPFAPRHVVEQGLLARRIEGRRLVSLEQALPATVGALQPVESAFGAPLLEGVVVGELEVVERRLVVGEGVGPAQVVPARSDLTEGPECEAVVVEADAARERVERSEPISSIS